MNISPTTLNYNIMTDLKCKADLNFDNNQGHKKCNDVRDHLKMCHHIDVRNKIHNDSLQVDPYWINGVHCHNSISRHNYTYDFSNWNTGL